VTPPWLWVTSVSAVVCGILSKAELGKSLFQINQLLIALERLLISEQRSILIKL